MSDEEQRTQVMIPADDEELSFEEGFKRTVEKLRPHITELWDYRKRFIYFNVAVFVVTLAILIFLVKPYYTSTVTILPDYGSKETTLSQLSNLASLAGVNVGQGSPTEVYQNLLTSEAVVAPVIYAKYKTEKYPDSVNLIQYFKIKPDKSLPADLQKRDMFIQEYKDLTKGRISTDIDRMTKILTVTVKMPEAQLSADVVNNLVESLDDYIRTKRRSYAVDQLEYIQKRMAQVKDSLTMAEDKLRDFREQNRLVVQSPELMLEQARLSRNVDILSAVFLELSKQYELAKIDEIKDTPIVNVRDYAKNPVLKAGPKRLVALVVVMFLSAISSGLYYGFRSNIKKYISYISNR
jgi:uncharacterized protein involved in exopolysaccharide biosynthesis